MSRFSAEHVLRLPVRAHGIDLGRVVDVLLDQDARRVVGVEIVGKDDAHRFLPLSAAQVRDDEITVSSPLAVLAADELDYYRKRASTVRVLRGAPVRREGEDLGRLRDVVLGADGAVTELVVENGRGRVHLPADDGVTIIGER